MSGMDVQAVNMGVLIRDAIKFVQVGVLIKLSW